MTTPQRPISARRKRTILCGSAHANSPFVEVLRDIASDLKAEFNLALSTAEFQAMMNLAADSVCLVGIDAAFPDVTGSARLAAQKASLSEIVIFASNEEQVEMRAKFGLAPRVGTHLRYLPSQAPGLAKSLRSAFQKADLRRSTRTTLDRFNARLTLQAASVDTAEMRQLVISDRFLYSILESAFDAVLLLDREGMVLAFNPSAEVLFEKPQALVISRPVWSLAGESWKKDTQHLGKVAKPAEMVHTVVELESGTKTVEISATPVYDRNNSLVATSLILRDVTARIRSEEALRTNEKLAAVGRLASSIAHEINNPLEAVTNLLYLARGSAEMAEVQQYLEFAEQELRRMTVITNQTLRFHKQSVGPVSVTCDDLLESVVGVYQSRFVNDQIKLDRRSRSSDTVFCLEGEIRQVLNNLVGNAIDAMRGTGGRLLLRTREGTNWKTGLPGAFITVADTGSGMSTQILKKIFEPFFTTKGQSGTGLGLWISQEIVERHQGALNVRSSQRDGKSGTVFTMFLPFAPTLNSVDLESHG
jgi:PAS domain S-box-containing protein